MKLFSLGMGVATILTTADAVAKSPHVGAQKGDAMVRNGDCSTTMDCSLNGDCVIGKCACDPAWSASPNCDAVSFQKLDKNNMPGYYNKTQSSWGGFPIKSVRERAL